jgi:hypothetical protein
MEMYRESAGFMNQKTWSTSTATVREYHPSSLEPLIHPLPQFPILLVYLPQPVAISHRVRPEPFGNELRERELLRVEDRFGCKARREESHPFAEVLARLTSRFTLFMGRIHRRSPLWTWYHNVSLSSGRTRASMPRETSISARRSATETSGKIWSTISVGSA